MTKDTATFLTDTKRNVFLIAFSQFGMTFSFTFMMAFMPFYIVNVSPYGHKETMIFTGLIMGATHIATALSATFWGGLTARLRPKFLYEMGFLCNGVLILFMGFTSNLFLLFLLRIAQGGLGGGFHHRHYLHHPSIPTRESYQESHSLSECSHGWPTFRSPRRDMHRFLSGIPSRLCIRYDAYFHLSIFSSSLCR
jgi:hypothetical protein